MAEVSRAVIRVVVVNVDEDNMAVVKQLAVVKAAAHST